MLQTQCYLVSEHDIRISNHCVMVHEKATITVFNSAGAVMRVPDDDRQGRRVMMGMLCAHGHANVSEVAEAFGVDRSTVARHRDRYQQLGVEGLKDGYGGARGGYKLNAQKLTQAQVELDAGQSIRSVAKSAGVAHVTILSTIKRGLLYKPGAVAEGSIEMESADALSQPSARSLEDGGCSGGVAVKRNDERMLACQGKLAQAEVLFEGAESVPGAGVVLALPLLLEQGLISCTEQALGAIRNGFFGLRTVVLMLAFMALLRVRNPEQLKAHAPGELGRLLGLDRVAEMKTVRRKIKEIGEQGRTMELASCFAEYWSKCDADALGYLYVDGHVRPYHGRKHELPKTFVARRRLSMPATTDHWVHTGEAQPWFFVTAEANDHLLAVLEEDLLPRIRTTLGDARRITVIFDRESWSPQQFQRWHEQGVDVITYRKGHYAEWPQQEFVKVIDDVRVRKGKKPTIYWLAQRDDSVVEKKHGIKMREIRRLCDNGHQTSIVTSCVEPTMLEVASRMFGRWRQENFFRYMREEFAIDHLTTYAVQEADAERLVPNPTIKVLKNEVAKMGRCLTKLHRDYARASTGTSATKVSDKKRHRMKDQIVQMQNSVDAQKARLKVLPERVPVSETMNSTEVVRLEHDRKIFTDLIKIVAYRTESAMMPLVDLSRCRDLDEGHAFLKAVFQTPADLIPCESENTLTVRMHCMAQPRFTRALRILCQKMTEKRVKYPGTDLMLVYDVLDCNN